MSTRDELMHEIERGGIILALPRPIGDDDLVIMFQTKEGQTAPMVWVGQDAPLEGDMVRCDSVGLDDDRGRLWQVRIRCWHASNMLMCMITPHADDDGGKP